MTSRFMFSRIHYLQSNIFNNWSMSIQILLLNLIPIRVQIEPQHPKILRTFLYTYPNRKHTFTRNNFFKTNTPFPLPWNDWHHGRAKLMNRDRPRDKSRSTACHFNYSRDKSILILRPRTNCTQPKYVWWWWTSICVYNI